MNKIKKFIILIFGFITLLFFIVFKKQGAGKFYIRAQEGGFLRKFLELEVLNFLFENYNYYKKTKNSDFSSFAKSYKKDYASKAYFKKNYGQDQSNNIEDQQRGLIIPKIKKIIENHKISNFLEIGSANGDLTAHLADLYPDKYFSGIDFNSDVAKENHKSSNLNFISDYALDYLKNDNTRKIDLIFSTSTFVHFTPNEIEKYFQVLNSKVKFIIISDPTFYNVHNKKIKKNSDHLELGVWFHDYRYYCEKYNFKIIENNFFNYKHKVSTRPDIVMNHLVAINKSV